ncbi:YjbH domain-containing protein [Lunatimonas salinarum]|uniref:YjbH domain-containing protein n=1 Tax=Lunatimonas salinarum TaxID=1774590 RepID=UPI001AE08E00|nr:YjbH domain-containing protein [Lunatimonas salinarum]
MRFIVLIACCFLISRQVTGQESVTLNRLRSAGFEQVSTAIIAKDQQVFFWEHRNFRSPYHSLKWARNHLEETDSVFFVPLYMNRPMGVYDANTFQYSPVSDEIANQYKNLNRPFAGYRWNFRISPDFSARFGDFETPFRSRTNVIVDTRVFILPGLSVQTGMLIPIQNNLGQFGAYVRLSPSHLNYFISPFRHHFLSLTAGTFFQDRYGVDVQYRYDDFNKRWNIGVEASLTGYYFIPGLSLYTESLNQLRILGDIEYRVMPWNVTTKLSIGRFLGNDDGIRFDIIKQYGLIDIGFFAAATRNGTSGGFQFAFPLFPGKLLRGKGWEIRTTEEFRWEYNYTYEAPIGRKFRLGMPRLADELRQYNSEFIQSLKR